MLTQMSRVNDLNSHLTIELVARRLPRELQQRWIERVCEIYESGRALVCQDLIDFVVKRARVAEFSYNSQLAMRDDPHRSSTNRFDPKRNGEGLNKATSFKISADQRENCPLCKTNHSLDACSIFSSMTVASRWRYILRNKRCLICLKHGHMASSCDPQGNVGNLAVMSPIISCYTSLISGLVAVKAPQRVSHYLPNHVRKLVWECLQ